MKYLVPVWHKGTPKRSRFSVRSTDLVHKDTPSFARWPDRDSINLTERRINSRLIGLLAKSGILRSVLVVGKYITRGYAVYLKGEVLRRKRATTTIKHFPARMSWEI